MAAALARYVKVHFDVKDIPVISCITTQFSSVLSIAPAVSLGVRKDCRVKSDSNRMLTEITINNFRSLRDVQLDLPKLGFFCGPNASGKTNLAEALDFLSHAFRDGLSYAVAEKGGFYNICFRRQRRSRGAIHFRIRGTDLRRSNKVQLSITAAFSIQTKGGRISSDFYVESEWYRFEFELDGLASSLTIERRGETYHLEGLDEVAPEILEKERPLNSFRSIFQEARGVLVPDERSLLYPNPFGDFLPYTAAIKNLAQIRVYRINPRTARQSGTPSVMGELGKFGENLPSALAQLEANNPTAYKRLVDEVRAVLPGLESLTTGYTDNRQMALFLSETGFGAPWQAEELSDGTLMTIALFLTVLDPRSRCVLIEEPENCLHPWILRRFLESCKAENKKQILITTQSPLVVSAAAPDNLFLVERHSGETAVTPAKVRDNMLPQIIGRNFLDLGEYWLSGGLKAVPLAAEAQTNLFKPED
jgi:predicted ATPase